MTTAQQVTVKHETGIVETGTIVARTHGADNKSVLVRFADRTEAWVPAFRVFAR